MERSLSILGLSKKETKVLNAVQKGFDTPVRINAETSVSRPAIYAILINLKLRRLVISHIHNRRKHWEIAPAMQIDEALYEAKRVLLGIREGKEELYGKSDVGITLYRGKEAILTLFEHLFTEHKKERYRGIQGDNVLPAWKHLLGIESINSLNRSIKKNGLIIEAILPEDFFSRVFADMGPTWAKDFEGRAYRANLIDEKYFSHGAEVFLFRDTVYLASMSEALVIEIKHSELQKMIASTFEFIQDHSRTVDGNEILRKLVKESK